MNRKWFAQTVAWLCAALLILLCCSGAYAEKQWVEMGTGAVKADSVSLKSAETNYAGLISDYGAGQWHVFNVDAQNTSYATQIQTCAADTWYTITINNSGIGMSGWNITGGLYLYLANGDGQWLIENTHLSQGDTTFKVRVEPGNPICLVFVAYNNSTGVVSFEIVPEDDAAGESMSAAAQKPAGEITAQTMAVPGDQDWYHVPSSTQGGGVALYVENRIEEDLSIEIYDEFKERLVEQSCSYGSVASVSYTREPGVSYYVKISGAQGKQTGRYFFGWCDGVAHVLEEQRVVTEATCAQEGVQGRPCTACGTVLFAQPIAMLEHEAGEPQTVLPPTCETEGVQVQNCIHCFLTLEKELLPALGHTEGDYVEELAPTCTADGLKTQHCTVCGELLNEEVLPALGHTEGDYVEELAPTCTADGLKTQHCTVCGELLNEETLPALGHTEGDYVEELAPTCTEDGLKTQHCTVCGELLNEEVLPAAGHRSELASEQPAACQEDGLRVYACSVCQATLNEEIIPAAGHQAGAELIETYPTCVAFGVRRQRCTVCEEVLAEDVVPALGHQAGMEQVEEEATCVAEGISRIRCSVCSEVLKEEKVPVTDHPYGAWQETVKPGLFKDGEEQSVCAGCGDVQTRAVPRLNLWQWIFGR